MITANYKIPVETAMNGKLAVDLYADAVKSKCGCNFRVPRLIIMDLGMPVMGGEEATS